MSECCYINAEFDLSLRGVELPARLARQTKELSLQALLGARSGDAALLREPVSDAFLEHLHSCGATVNIYIIYVQIGNTRKHDRTSSRVAAARGWRKERLVSDHYILPSVNSNDTYLGVIFENEIRYLEIEGSLGQYACFKALDSAIFDRCPCTAV